MIRILLAGLGLAASLATPALAAAAPSLSITGGVDYSRGDFGLTEDSRILVVPLSARLTSGAAAFTASLPCLRLETPGGVVLGPDGRPLPGVPTDGGKRSGMGDLSLGARLDLPVELFDLSVGGQVKLPTAKEGLGTGKADLSGSVEIGRSFGPVSPFVEVGYRLLGDSATLPLRSGPTLSAGSSVELGNAVLIGSWDYARSASAGTANSSELFGGLAVPVGGRFTVTGYGTRGLSEGSADYGLGLLLTARVF